MPDPDTSMIKREGIDWPVDPLLVQHQQLL